MKVQCDYCSKALNRKPSWVKRHKHHFCNHDHHYKWQREQERPLSPCHTCPQCGGPKSYHAKTCRKCYMASERAKQVQATNVAKAQAAVRGSTRGPEQREQYKQAALDRWNRPGERSRASKRRKAYWAKRDHPSKDTHLSDETKKKISEANTGKKRSAETCRRMSEIAKRRTSTANPFYGKHHTAETRRKQSFAKTGKVPNWYGGIYHSPIAGDFKYQSSFELRFARVLDALHWSWERNCDWFKYYKADKTQAFYTPDFKVDLEGQVRYFETKGYFPKEVQNKVQQAQLQAPLIVITLPLLEMFERYVKSDP